ncbi:TIGR03087 family PEP-CTERM/XrtA system glycosyltransferase [Parvularcula sp. LCG005]|uniref:TIGR03087 family PEP-CTERM/XrtA system glycosyltransferase n=1 Tax=Parvularcula sp. LCG005 TaxID=3078805 RepID=UPI002941D6CD|nr:TIGR03087 family PEP-CTERM/XrtA system glycosyltransferase [Parvularcula sp. LCG005]WOI52521.1 TIGR03087 family PEP-CTERM/XrtA system glycosyltransferase [Parvularcula sp. LCG005]
MTARARQKAIFLCHRIPYPPDKGDKIRSWNLLRHLAGRYEVSLGCLIDDPADMQYRAVLDDLCAETFYLPLNRSRMIRRSLTALAKGRAVSFGIYRDRAMREWVERQRRTGPAVEIAFSSQMAPYLEHATAPAIIDLCDADSAKFAAYAENGNGLRRAFFRREARLVQAEERAMARWAAALFLVSPEEADLVRPQDGGKADKVDWFRNGVDTEYWAPEKAQDIPAEAFDIIFTGAMDYRPNIEAAVWFVKAVWPQLRRVHPHLTFGIVGARPTDVVLALAQTDGVTVTGRVPDIRPYLTASKIAVAPLGIARGVQNKVLEAMAMGKPVVASPGAVTGTGAAPGTHLVCADGAEETFTAIDALLASPSEAARLGEAAQTLIRTSYRWSDTLARFDAALPRSPTD